MTGQNVVGKSFCRAAVVIVSALLLSNCGFKDDPVPPDDVAPEPVNNLSYQLSDKGAVLSWYYPTKSVNGESLAYVDSFKIYKATIPAASYCEGCPIPFEKVIKIRGGIVPKEQGEKKAVYEVTGLQPGNFYVFKVRSVAGWWAESADSNRVSFYWQVPLKAPVGVQAAPERGAVKLVWQPVRSRQDGTKASGMVKYQIYRSVAGAEFQPVAELQTNSSWIDKGVVAGKNYSYKVQAKEVFPHGAVAGLESAVAQTKAVDFVVPKVPKEVRAIATAKSVRVFWEPVADLDVKEYRVYRRNGEGGRPVVVGSVADPYAMFIDSKIPAGAEVLYYSVSSIDDTGNESKRSSEVTVKP